jgi:hypothetical protein
MNVASAIASAEPAGASSKRAETGKSEMTDLTNERLVAETRKWIAEEYKLGAERAKLYAEREKLFQESLKLERERWWYVPLALLGNGALAAIIGAVVARLFH